MLTERLSLEPLRADHAREMAPMLADPTVYRYTGGSPPSVAELELSYARRARGVSPDGRRGWLNWVLRLRPEGRPAGFIQATLSAGDRGLDAELAWVIASRDRGAGLASEAAVAVIAWLRTVDVATFSAYIDPHNRASIAVARRLGLAPTAARKGAETRWAGG